MKKSLLAIDEVNPEQLSAMVKNIMDQMKIKDPMEAVRRMNSREWIVSEVVRRWYEQDAVIDFTLQPTDGTTGPGWIERHRQRGIGIEWYAENMLLSDSFKPTTGVVYKIKVLKGRLFSDGERITSNIRASAYAGIFTQGQKLFDPNMEAACLIREMFTDEEIEAMGLSWIFTMHEPFEDYDGDLNLLGAGGGSSGSSLRADYGHSDNRWHRDYGFAFTVV